MAKKQRLSGNQRAILSALSGCGGGLTVESLKEACGETQGRYLGGSLWGLKKRHLIRKAGGLWFIPEDKRATARRLLLKAATLPKGGPKAFDAKIEDLKNQIQIFFSVRPDRAYTIGQVAANVAEGRNRDSIRATLSRLAAEGWLRQLGKGKYIRYTPPPAVDPKRLTATIQRPRPILVMAREDIQAGDIVEMNIKDGTTTFKKAQANVIRPPAAQVSLPLMPTEKLKSEEILPPMYQRFIKVCGCVGAPVIVLKGGRPYCSSCYRPLEAGGHVMIHDALFK